MENGVRSAWYFRRPRPTSHNLVTSFCVLWQDQSERICFNCR